MDLWRSKQANNDILYRRGATTTDGNRQGRLQNRPNLKETELVFSIFLFIYFLKSFAKVEFTFNEIHVSNQ